MKIAIISDIHGNLEALKATLRDIESRNVDKIICLGDIIAKGVHQKECLKLVQDNCDVVLRGNCDRHFSTDYPKEIIEKMTDINKQRYIWNKTMLNNEDKNYLNKLPFSTEFYMSGSLVRLFHATPNEDDKVIINEDDFNTKYQMFLPSENTVSKNIADVVIYGHIHHSYMDRLYNKTIINVGSVGNAFDVIRNDAKDSSVLETTKANYLIIEGEYGGKEYNKEIAFQFVKVPYNIDEELEDEEENIEKEEYRYEIKKGVYRDMSKIDSKFTTLGIDVSKI